MQTLHLSPKDVERLRHARDCKLLDMLSRSMIVFPEEPIKFFHHYDCEVRRVQPEPGTCTILVPPCDLVLSGNGENRPLAQGSEVLGVVSPESLIFVLAVTRPSGELYQFIDISMRSTLESLRTSRQYTGGGMSRLILQFDVDDSLSVNGKRQISGGSTLSLSSRHDLTDLHTAIEPNGKQMKRQSTDLSTLTRVSSSIIISLDTNDDDDDDASGPFDHSQARFENEEQSLVYCLRSMGICLKVSPVNHKRRPAPMTVPSCLNNLNQRVESWEITSRAFVRLVLTIMFRTSKVVSGHRWHLNGSHQDEI